MKVWRRYEDFVEELSARFPHERRGIKAFYGECWAVFNALNSLELKSLEEPRYLLGGKAKYQLNPPPVLCPHLYCVTVQKVIVLCCAVGGALQHMRAVHTFTLATSDSMHGVSADVAL